MVNQCRNDILTRLEESGNVDFIVGPHLLNTARRTVSDPLTVDVKGVTGIRSNIDFDLFRWTVLRNES